MLQVFFRSLGLKTMVLLFNNNRILSICWAWPRDRHLPIRKKHVIFLQFVPRRNQCTGGRGFYFSCDFTVKENSHQAISFKFWLVQITLSRIKNTERPDRGNIVWSLNLRDLGVRGSKVKEYKMRHLVLKKEEVKVCNKYGKMGGDWAKKGH